MSDTEKDMKSAVKLKEDVKETFKVFDRPSEKDEKRSVILTSRPTDTKEIDRLEARLSFVKQKAVEVMENLEVQQSEFVININEIHEIKEQLETYEERFQTLNENYLKLLENKDESVVQKIYEAEEFSDSLMKAVVRCTNLVRQYNSRITSKTAKQVQKQASSTNIKLPELKIPVFSGNLTEWVNFWDTFRIAVHENESVSTIHKFTYLKGQLKGDAARAISSLNLTECNYEKAVKILQERFGESTVLCAAYSKQLSDLITIQNPNDVEKLRYFYDTCQSILCNLEAISTPQHSFSESESFYLMMPLISSKLPLEILTQWSKEAKKEVGKQHDMKEFLGFLRNEIESREMGIFLKNPVTEKTFSEERQKTFMPQKQFTKDTSRVGIPVSYSKPLRIPSVSTFRPIAEKYAKQDRPRDPEKETFRENLYLKPSTASTLQATVEQKKVVEDEYYEKRQNAKCCIFCEEQHFSAYCEKVKTMQLKERLDKAKEKGACFNCLNLHHRSNTCPKKDTLKCKVCAKNHHTFFHYDKESTQPKPTKALMSKVSEMKDTTIVFKADEARPKEDLIEPAKTSVPVLMQTAKVIVKSQGKEREVRIMLDSGSDRSFISSEVCKALNCEVVRTENLKIGTFGGKKNKNTLWEEVEVCLKPLEENESETISIPVKLLVISEICSKIRRPPVSLLKSEILELQKNKMADQYANEEENLQIDLLIGLDYYWQIVESIQRMEEDGYILLNSKFGLILQGIGRKLDETNGKTDVDYCNNSLFINSCYLTEHDLNETLKSFWTTESIGILQKKETSLSKEDEEAVDQFHDTIKFKEEEGRYSVGLPWKKTYINEPNKVPSNRKLALRRLYRLVFRLRKEPNLLKMYDDAMKESLKLDFAEKCTETEIEVRKKNLPVSYIPHRAVIKQDRQTTKCRIVFDASAHEPGENSLNCCIIKGPPLQPDLLKLLLQFRLYRVVLIADVAKAFPQIEIQQRDRDVLRYFWFEDIQEVFEGKFDPREYKMKRVPFGVNASPFLLNKTIQHHLESYPKDSEVINDLKTQLYVDDLISGADDEDSAYSKYLTMNNVMQDGGMTLRKWKTNSEKLREQINLKEKMKSESESLPESINDTKVKVLGLTVNLTEDKISFEKPDMENLSEEDTLTKRKILSNSAKIFDPIGLLAPYIIRVKILFQSLWKKGLGWDDPVPQEITERMLQWFYEMEHLNKVKIPRYVGLMMEKVDDTNVSVHGFCDAGKFSYAACVYIVIRNNEVNESHLLLAKSKVAPLQSMSIPNLELMAALILARMVDFLRSISLLRNINYYLWSDSRVTLQRLKNDTEKQKVFVSNRVTEINQLTHPESWRYCPSKENIADLITKGCPISFLIENKTWWRGPEWIRKDEYHWPTQENYKNVLKDKVATVNINPTQSNTNKKEMIDSFVSKFSSYEKMIRSFSCVLKFLEVMRARRQGRNISSEYCSVSDLYAAEMKLIQMVQQTHYNDEYEDLRKGSPIHKNSPLKTLNPYIDSENVMRVSGRINRTPELTEQQKSLIIIPNKSYFTELYIQHLHKLQKHGDITAILSQTRDRFWITKGRRSIRSVLRRCPICRIYKAQPYNPVMGNLPEDRIKKAAPFRITGVDFVGPVFIKDDDHRKKAYICLFTCANIRAVHLELVDDLTTREFIFALKRFISRRGICEVIYSDNALTFKKASRLLNDGIDFEEVKEFATTFRIIWKFSVERAPWWGGFFERLVRSIKSPLRRVIGKSTVDRSELVTLLCEIEAQVNSRPLTYVTEEIQDINFILTPSHFLIGKRLNYLPFRETEEDLLNNPEDLRERLEYQQRIAESFWVKWREQYLKELIPLTKWTSNGQEVQIGDFVLVEEKQIPRHKWKVGIVQEVKRDNNNIARSALVKISDNKIIRRAARQLFYLETIKEFESELQEHTHANEVWCICQEPWNNRFMIGCDSCKNWFHGDCVNILEDDILEEEWFCPQCMENVTTTNRNDSSPSGGREDVVSRPEVLTQ